MNLNKFLFTLCFIWSLFPNLARAEQIVLANPSFELPAIVLEPNTYPALPMAQDWIELDNDLQGSQNTGIFYNIPGSPYWIDKADGLQIAFLGSQTGNGFAQEPNNTIYRPGSRYRLIVGICPSTFYPPEPNCTLALTLYYRNGLTTQNIATTTVPPSSLVQLAMRDFWVDVPRVAAGAAWAGKPLGLSMKAIGAAGGFWDLDNVRLWENPPDFNNDNFVNLADFALLAGEWLSCTNPSTDLTGDGCVNQSDLQLLAEYWLKNL